MKFLKFDKDKDSTSLYFEIDEKFMAKFEFRNDLFHAYKYEKLGECGFGREVGRYQSEVMPNAKEINNILDSM